MRTFRTRIRRYVYGRNLFADRLFENFLVSAVASIVLLRVILAIAGYPTFAPGGLHIAHMLWGGLGMLVGIVILLASLSPLSAPVAAVIGGIGFGVFIDELGKFVTSDNNYFFEPTIAIIYVIFIVLYLGVKGLTKDKHSSEETRLINALELMKSGVLGPLSSTDQQRIRELLARCGQDHTLVRALSGLLHDMEVSSGGNLGILARMRRAPARVYAHIRTNRWFAWGVMVFFIGQAVVRLVLDVISVRQVGQWFFIWLVVVLIVLIVAFWQSKALQRIPRAQFLAILVVLALAGLAALWFAVRAMEVPRFEIAEWGEVVSSGVANIVVVVGLLRLRESRLAAFKIFRLALLMLIFFTQFFAFYRSQLVAGVELAVNLLIYGILRYMIDQEEGAQIAETVEVAEVIVGRLDDVNSTIVNTHEADEEGEWS